MKNKLQHKEHQVHLIDLANRFLVPSLERRVQQLTDQRDGIAEELEDLNVRFEDLKRGYAHLEEINRNQRQKMQKLNKQLEQMYHLKDLASIAEHIFMGELDKTNMDYLRNLYEARFAGTCVQKMDTVLTGNYSMGETFIK